MAGGVKRMRLSLREASRAGRIGQYDPLRLGPDHYFVVVCGGECLVAPVRDPVNVRPDYPRAAPGIITWKKQETVEIVVRSAKSTTP